MTITIENLLAKVRSYYPITESLSNVDVQSTESKPIQNIDLLLKAYQLAEKAHEGQFRQSGEPYVVHPLAVAYNLAEMRLDIAALCAGILHDCVEDTPVTAEQIQSEFGQEIAFLVEGVTKLGQILWQNRQEQAAENFRKMLLAMARDIRVVLIKLCDRLDNMKSLSALSAEKQKRISKETLDIYAPLAHRLGIQWIKVELEDLAFRNLYPKEYEELKEKLQKHFVDRPAYIAEVEEQLREVLKENGIEAQVSGRIKHLWSIYQKTVKTGQDVDQLYDIVAFRAILNNVRDCYGALGVIHGTWTPVPGRFKDFIALPKPNGYRSLHTTLIGPRSERIEVQFRTKDMNQIAEEGIAAHWRYKEGQPDRTKNQDEKTFAWLHQLMEWQRTLKDPTEFIETVKVDLFSDEVFVFTPQGDVKVLPHGATPVDFAYLVHTVIGNQCVGARINGFMVPLSYQLRNGDTVQILTNASHHPNKDWLRFVVSSSAKSKIRNALRTEQREKSKSLGKELLEKELRKYGLSYKEKEKQGSLLEVAQYFRLPSMDDLAINIGYGKILSADVVERIIPPHERQPISKPISPSSNPKIAPNLSSGIQVAGEDSILVRFGKCCSPVPGDPIFGIITRGRGVTVHTKTCSHGLAQDEARRVDANWSEQTKIPRPVSIQVRCTNRMGLLAQLSQVFQQHGLNISQAHCKTIDDTHAVNTFTCRIKDIEQLSHVISALREIPSVESVQRM